MMDDKITSNEPKVEKAEKNSSFFLDMKRLLSFSLPWKERTILEKSYTALFVVMLLAILPMPYEFYNILRVLVCIGLYFFFQEILPERKSKRKWFILIIGLFVLYNPVIPIHIGDKAVWAFINAGTIYILFRARLVFDRRQVYNSVLPEEPIQDDPSQGVFQMKNFPYKTYDEWKVVFRRAASKSNDALAIQNKDGFEWSLLDLMDDEPCRRAYNAHLNPEPLGTKFGEQFNIDDVEFEDGVRTGDFIKTLP